MEKDLRLLTYCSATIKFKERTFLGATSVDRSMCVSMQVLIAHNQRHYRFLEELVIPRRSNSPIQTSTMFPGH